MLTNLLQDPYGIFAFLATADKTKMADKLQDTINLPVAIPAWGLLVAIAGGIFSFASIQTKLEAVIERTSQIEAIRERQINNVQILLQQQKTVEQHELRLIGIEKEMWSKPRGK